MTARVAEAELPRAAAVLGDAFQQDPLFAHAVPDAAARVDAVVAYLAARRHANGVPDHWYLSMLGVRRPAQGRGLGAAVLAPRLRAGEEAGEWCYLETLGPRNVPCSERHGFEVVEADTDPGSGLPYWLFLRPPSGGR